MKKQTDFTFDEAKEATVGKLAMLASFAESLHVAFPDKALLEWIRILRMIEEKVDSSSKSCLSKSEIKMVYDFGQELTRCNPDLNSQLTQFWSLYHDVFKMLGSRRNGQGYSLQSLIDRSRSRINVADALAETIVSVARKKTSNLLSPAAFLLVHIVRTETIEYVWKTQLNDAIERHGLKGRYDIEAMCSVQSKVKRGDRWQTDVRAIRDATAHGRFEIKRVRNDWEIEFHNETGGYHFHKRFSRKEFTKFFDLHTMLYKLQLHLVVILELLPILTTHFLRSEALV